MIESQPSVADAQRLVGVAALPSGARGLPAQLSSFVGRGRELAEVLSALARTRILTLTGPGGCGKTRLALRAGEASRRDDREGRWWVDLGPLPDADLVGPAVAAALGVRPSPGLSDMDVAVAFLRPRRALVVLDNCEHVLDEAARAAEALARGCPSVTVLATSREPLRVPGETEWRVPPLSPPPPDAGESPGPARESDALALFAERAEQVRPGFRPTDAEVAAIARICRDVDGMPLAIELAAARLRMLSPQEVADGLSQRLRLLTGGPRTALPRQRTVRASIDWSHDLLTREQQVLFRRLGVFAGGFTLEGAEAVCESAGIPTEAVLELLAALVEKSLVVAEHAGAVTRYRLLGTVREYATERLAAAGELDRTLDRHRDAYLRLAERLAPRLLTPQQAHTLDALDLDAPNFEQAIHRAAATDAVTGLRLCAALTLWWRLRGNFTVADAAFRRALDAAPSEPSALRAEAHWGRAYLLAFSGRFDEAVPAARRALGEAERAGDPRTAARALMVLGKCDLMHRHPAECRVGLERARELAGAAGDDLCLMHVGHALAFSHLFQDDHPAARRRFDEVLAIVERTGHHEFLGNHWAAAGWMRYLAGDLPAAQEALERATTAARGVGDAVTEAGAAAYAACAQADAGRPDRALDLLLPAHDRAMARGAGFLLPWSEVAIAYAQAAAGRLEEARAAFERLMSGPAGGIVYPATWAAVGYAETLRLLGRLGDAEAVAGRALQRAEELGNPWLASGARLVCGRVAAAEGRWSDAETLHHEALAALVAGRYRIGLPGALEALADVAAGVAGHVEATRILGAARRARRDLGVVAWPHARAEVEALTARLRDVLGDEAVARALSEGGELPAEEAVAWLRRARGQRRRPPGGWEGLTPTEIEVVRHAAAGLTNPEIGKRMFISRSTVKAHLGHVYAKLAVRNRAELAAQISRAPAAVRDALAAVPADRGHPAIQD